MSNLIEVLKGGPGSGDFGHGGRPGKRGGSGKGRKLKLSNMKSSDNSKQDPTKVKAVLNSMNTLEDTFNIANEQIVSTISKKADVPKDAVREYAFLWHTQDINDKAIILESVKREFGIELSPYEKDNGVSERSYDKHKILDFQKISRVMYEDTQKELEKLAINELVLYRGLSSETDIPRLNIGQSTIYQANTIESWSINKEVAEDYSQMMPNGVVLSSVVPRDRIFSMPSIGIGSSTDEELIIFGNGPNDIVVIDMK